MNSLDDVAAMKQKDPSGVLASTAMFPDQCQQAWEESQKVVFPDEYKKVKNIVVAGMGGSRFTPKTIGALYRNKIKVSYEICEDYTVPGYVNSDSLVILCSYSGTTEEVLAAGEDARKKGAKIAGIMSKMPTDKILIGSLAIALLGTSLIPFAYSMKLMENVSWTTLGVAATSLIAFSLAAFGLGTLMFTGVGALLFGAGILSIIALGGAMAIFGAGTKIAGESLSNSFIDKIERLANSGTKLIAASVGILALSGAISVFSLSMTGSNVLDRFAGIFGGSSAIDNIERLANSSAQLMQSANALKSIEVSIKGIADVKGLENIAEGIKIYNESESINEGIDKVNKKLDDVIKAINENKNIYIDGRKINESIARSTQLNKLS